jgi:hypothetical protein
LKGKEHNVLPNKLIDVINGSKPIKRDDKCHNVACQTRDQARYDVTYINSVAGLGLASQEVTFLTNSTNKIAINLYGYDKMTKPYFSIQTQVKNQQDIILLGLVEIS